MKNSLTRIAARGNGNGHAQADRFEMSRVFTETQQTVVSSVVSTPLRLIDLLEHADSDLFTIRETEYQGSSDGGVSVQHIRLYRDELMRLENIVRTALAREGEKEKIA